MRHSLSIIAVSAIIFSSAARPNGGPSRSDMQANVTRVDVMVEDASGKSVSGLTRDDFEIWSDGQRRPIEIFSPASATTPLTLVVLVDITASQIKCPGVKVLPEPGMSTAGRAAGSSSSIGMLGAWGEFAIQGFRPADRIQVGAVGRRLTMSGRFTGDAGEIKNDWRALFEVPPIEGLGPSPIWDGVEEAAAALANEPGHRAIVLITDGQASGNVHSHSEASVHAALAGISVSVVAEESMLPTLPLTSMASHGVDPTSTLRSMADFTGGGFGLARAEFPPDDRCFLRDPAPHFRRAIDRLHQAYMLGFVPQVADGKPHPLEVRVNKPGMFVRARKIFTAGRGNR